MFLSALDGASRSPPRTSRQLADRHCGYQECEERDPVLRIGDAKSADWWQEKVIQSDSRDQRHENRLAQAPRSGNSEDAEQEGQSDGGRIEMDQTKSDKGNTGYRECRDNVSQRGSVGGFHELIVTDILQGIERTSTNSDASTTIIGMSKTPEQWLEECSPTKKGGRFKLFLGYAPGVGKTHTMLTEAIRRHNRGEDIVIGVVETHGRKAVGELVTNLEVVPRKKIEYKGALFEEMDVDAILARKPCVALVDELAHTNIEDSKHHKRYEDVLELLDAGIDVLSTMNIQHLESITPTVQGVTGIQVRETVPDWVLQRVSEVVMIDLTP